jgi:uncharacterized iron-regulated protein
MKHHNDTDGTSHRAWTAQLKYALLACLLPGLLWSCAMKSKTLSVEGMEGGFAPGDIISAEQGTLIDRGAVLADLETAGVVYVGETHTDPAHHQVQMEVLEALYSSRPGMSVGMEMFDVSYQAVLDEWSAGKLAWDEFLQKTNWYANWRYPAALYKDILEFVKSNRLALVALNIPFHIPPKISTGGLDSLSDTERAYLPAEIDTGVKAHRQYMQKVFKGHRVPGRNNFEFFYMAQCVWEDKMAESVAAHTGPERPMLVIIGNGHIIYKFGVPLRAEKRNGLSFRTVYPASAGQETSLDVADYIWVTEPRKGPPRMR